MEKIECQWFRSGTSTNTLNWLFDHCCLLLFLSGCHFDHHACLQELLWWVMVFEKKDGAACHLSSLSHIPSQIQSHTWQVTEWQGAMQRYLLVFMSLVLRNQTLAASYIRNKQIPSGYRNQDLLVTISKTIWYNVVRKLKMKLLPNQSTKNIVHCFTDGGEWWCRG